MKTFLFYATLFLALAASAVAQSTPERPFTLTGTQCASISVDGKATVAFQILGSWSGTIQPQAAIAGQSAVNLQIAPAASATPQSTVTANGAYVANVSGYSTFLLCGNTITGTASAYVNPSKYSH